MPDDIRINIQSSFSSEGAESVKADARELREEFEQLAESIPHILRITLKHGGGFSDHPADPGGATMRGVTQRTYDGYRKRRGLSPRPVREIEEHELQDIYRDIWDRESRRAPPGLKPHALPKPVMSMIPLFANGWMNAGALGGVASLPGQRVI